MRLFYSLHFILLCRRVSQGTASKQLYHEGPETKVEYMEMIYRGLSLFTRALQRGETDERVAYLAIHTKWFGTLKAKRNNRTSPADLPDLLSLTSCLHPVDACDVVYDEHVAHSGFGLWIAKCDLT